MAFITQGENAGQLKKLFMDSIGRKKRKAVIKMATEETCPQTHYLSFSQNTEEKNLSMLFKLKSL